METCTRDELREKYNQLRREYDEVQEAMFHYNDYARSNPSPLSPRSLHKRREELFREMRPIIIQLREHEVDKQNIDYWVNNVGD